MCSHDRSWRYFCEALERPYAFEARAAKDCDAWKAGRGSNQTIFMGDNIDTKFVLTYYYLRIMDIGFNREFNNDIIMQK